MIKTTYNLLLSKTLYFHFLLVLHVSSLRLLYFSFILFFLFFLQDSPDSVVYQAPASTAATQVRVIMRDMTGKNVWDYTLLHRSSSADSEYTGKILKNDTPADNQILNQLFTQLNFTEGTDWKLKYKRKTVQIEVKN